MGEGLKGVRLKTDGWEFKFALASSKLRLFAALHFHFLIISLIFSLRDLRASA
jgi:hypothetical protein